MPSDESAEQAKESRLAEGQSPHETEGQQTAGGKPPGKWLLLLVLGLAAAIFDHLKTGFASAVLAWMGVDRLLAFIVDPSPWFFFTVLAVCGLCATVLLDPRGLFSRLIPDKWIESVRQVCWALAIAGLAYPAVLHFLPKSPKMVIVVYDDHVRHFAPEIAFAGDVEIAERSLSDLRLLEGTGELGENVAVISTLPRPSLTLRDLLKSQRVRATFFSLQEVLEVGAHERLLDVSFSAFASDLASFLREKDSLESARTSAVHVYFERPFSVAEESLTDALDGDFAVRSTVFDRALVNSVPLEAGGEEHAPVSAVFLGSAQGLVAFLPKSPLRPRD